ncbi:MAG: TIGR00266 family protein [Phycisphaera sp. TMED24]|nr:MAG: TIGR00266 family protein [Phycisphaera sp. TMED24]
MFWVVLGVKRPFTKHGGGNSTNPPKNPKKTGRLPFMARFILEGSTDPFLRVDLTQGDMIHAESGAMASMSSTLELKGKARGGMLSGLMRKALSGESFFMQEISAEQGPGTVRLAPSVPGEVRVIDMSNACWFVGDGGFLACDDEITLETSRQKLAGALLGGTGGLFILKATGTGSLAVSAFGAITEVELNGQDELIVDNGHVVAWQDTLDYTPSLSTKNSGGMLSKIGGSMKSGEGVVMRFSGQGRVLVSSRSRPSFVSWLVPQLPSRK